MMKEFEYAITDFGNLVETYSMLLTDKLRVDKFVFEKKRTPKENISNVN